MPKIHALPPLTDAPDNADVLAMDDASVSDPTSPEKTKKITVEQLKNYLMPTGTIADYAGATAPDGWLLCYGQTVSRTTYAALFAVIGTLFGAGDGSTTFGIPDLRGRVIAGQDDMGGTSANRLTGVSGGVDGDVLGATGGAEKHTLSLSQIPNATGSLGLHGGESGSIFVSRSGVFVGGNIAANYKTIGTTGGSQSIYYSIDFSLGGGGGAHNNVQPTMILNKIIRC